MVVAVSVCALVAFVAGVFFGAYLQRKVYWRNDIVPPTPSRSKAHVVPKGGQTEMNGYQSPYEGYDH